MHLKFRVLREQVRSSLFYVPMLFVIGGFALGQLALAIDERVHHVGPILAATVDSARAVLSIVAGATISFAGIAFSVSLLLISLSSSQYSPRVVHGLFRDPHNKRVMGVVIGTFTYCLIVLRAVRGPLEEAGQPVVPSISIALAVVLGVVAILSIIAFISHSAHTMDVSEILHDVTEEALKSIRSQWSKVDEESDAAGAIESLGDDAFAIEFDRDGWVQEVDTDGLLAAIAPGTTLELETVPGRYAIPGTPIARVLPAPEDPKALCRAVRGAVSVGRTRTMRGDPTYGVRLLADVALKALSPGINDPTTAQDAMFHLGTLVRELLSRSAPARRRVGDRGRVVLLADNVTHREVVTLAFDEVRLASAGQPTVQIYLLELLRLLLVALKDAPTETIAALRQQAELIADLNDRADLPDADRDRVTAAFVHRFGDRK
ncbi:DUF2254 domain-containing protein [soil metagenome]